MTAIAALLRMLAAAHREAAEELDRLASQPEQLLLFKSAVAGRFRALEQAHAEQREALRKIMEFYT